MLLSQSAVLENPISPTPFSTFPDVSRFRVLVADDQPDILLALKLLLAQNGYHVETVNSPQTVLEALTADLSLEVGGRATLVAGIAQCEVAQDYISREILEEILRDTEDHIDFLETQLKLVSAMGEANYIQSAVGELEE